MTKSKHPGRVESGKRLAERNRLKRLELKNKEHKEKIITQEEKEESKEEEEKIIEKTILKNGDTTKNICILLLVAVVGGSFYFREKIIQKLKTNKNETKEVKSEPEKPDPFYME